MPLKKICQVYGMTDESLRHHVTRWLITPEVQEALPAQAALPVQEAARGVSAEVLLRLIQPQAFESFTATVKEDRGELCLSFVWKAET
jgi:hypothetical protein